MLQSMGSQRVRHDGPTELIHTYIRMYIYISAYVYIHTHIYVHTYSFLSFPSHLGSVQFSYSVMSHSLQPHELQHARPPCPSPTPRVHSNSQLLSR